MENEGFFFKFCKLIKSSEPDFTNVHISKISRLELENWRETYSRSIIWYAKKSKLPKFTGHYVSALASYQGRARSLQREDHPSPALALTAPVQRSLLDGRDAGGFGLCCSIAEQLPDVWAGSRRTFRTPLPSSFSRPSTFLARLRCKSPSYWSGSLCGKVGYIFYI